MTVTMGLRSACIARFKPCDTSDVESTVRGSCGVSRGIVGATNNKRGDTMELTLGDLVEISSEDYDDMFQSLVDSLHDVDLAVWAKVRDALVPDLVVNGVEQEDANMAVKIAACYFMDESEYSEWDIVDYVCNQLFDCM